MNIAFGGRSKQKLLQLRNELSKINPIFSNIPVLVADLANVEALAQMVNCTKVVLNTAGNFHVISQLHPEPSDFSGSQTSQPCPLKGQNPRKGR